MSFLSNLIKKAAPVVAAVAPGTPIGTAAQVVTVAQQRQEQKYQRNLAIDEFAKQQQRMNNMEFRDTDSLNRTIYNSGG